MCNKNHLKSGIGFSSRFSTVCLLLVFKNMEAKKGRGYTDVIMTEVKLWHALEKFETVQFTNYWNSGMIAGLTV
jgi:hypothetical protein